LWILVVFAMREPLQYWLLGEERYDEAALQEWLDEARGYRGTLREMVEDYLSRAREYTELRRQAPPEDPEQAAELHDRQVKTSLVVAVRHDEIYEQLKTLGVPPTKRYAGQLPLFPIIYRLQVRFRLEGSPLAEMSSVRVGDNGFRLDEPITWDSGLPFDASQYQVLEHRLHDYATIFVRYQLHAYNKRQRIEQAHHQRLRQLSALAVAGTVLGLTWMVIVQRRERERERQRIHARQTVDRTERMLLQEERRHAETERQLLEQRLATQAAERQALELKSQMWASIGIMAGSYAHNIKNLLVRPNDLLRRCMEVDGLSSDQSLMLHEVQQTLGTVTERLQQILHTVRRDPSHAEATLLDLNVVVGELERTWKDLAREKWKLELVPELNAHLGNGRASTGEPLWIAGDVSHLQQAIENLLFNARDATFEMRNHLRDAARQAENLDGPSRRQALIAAAAWKGRVILRTLRCDGSIVLEVCDNGAGMTEEVRRRCTEAHFSTKRDNAIYEGQSTGMGLGLSFVVAILEHHHARLEIDSEPLCGTTFRIRFPDTEEAAKAELTRAESEGPL
jgi:signal transduction histidine kinase